ncbi:hypothetical protein GCM10023201_41150 [Actinomycetospora corticicola]|uniref:Uncharacterized protein n=1 Tax=Actinomycetospora corticicola TaxID=663602 RepID=A0A7Y9DWG5_9PSEU|nr:hypothetical protein [Actinomycetospora corticicola]NYD36798.1 hypothetical protein [Actinomycetospora corticicola]
MTRPHDPTSPRWDLRPEPLPVDLDALPFGPTPPRRRWCPCVITEGGSPVGFETDPECPDHGHPAYQLDEHADDDPACDDPDCTCHNWLAETFAEPPWTTLAPNPEYL